MKHITKILTACCLMVAAVALAIGVSGCRNNQPEYCTVKGTIKGLKEGTKIRMEDEFNHFKVIETTRVKDGHFEYHPRISSPTHVYLYSQDDIQLKDFFLEPGTIVVDVDASDEKDYEVNNATGTASNDIFKKIDELENSGDQEAAEALKREVINAEQAGPLALYYAAHWYSSAEALGILDRLMPELAEKQYVAELREELTRRIKTEPAPEGIKPNYFIDMTYPDATGKPVSLKSVVNNPANRYVLLDFWATWCSGCVEKVPQLKELYTKYHEKGLEIYSVAENPDVEYWKTFIKKNGMTWVNVCDDQPGRDGKAWKDYTLSGIPTVLLIDGETGAIIARDVDMNKILGELLQ
ncbi:MAG: AhpC/TSA family protein [Bacteroidales bacterium]|nr:AhpC/TSA family protein [Bacteroidales bacterium]